MKKTLNEITKETLFRELVLNEVIHAKPVEAEFTKEAEACLRLKTKLPEMLTALY